MPLNLDLYSGIVERYMLDTGRLLRPAEDADATMDPVTLELTVAEAQLYSGKCMVSPMGSASQQDLGGTTARQIVTYEIAIPMAVDAQPNDYFVVDSARDTTLVAKRFRIIGTMPGTFAVARRMTAVLEEVASE